MKMNPQSYENDDELITCQICKDEHPRRLMMIFNRGRNMYGLPDGTILCHCCLGQHELWMLKNGQWTGNAETVKPQEIHAIGLRAHWKNLGIPWPSNE